MVTARAAAATSARLICTVMLLMAVGCSSLWSLRGRDDSAPSFTYHSPASNENVSGMSPVLVSVEYRDDGTGVDPRNVTFVVVPPRGELLRYEDSEDFIIRDKSMASIKLQAPKLGILMSGVWTINAYAHDRAGNLSTSTWTFRITQ